MTEEEARESFTYDSRLWVRGYVPQPGEMTYRHLVGEFLKKFTRDRYEEPAARTAIHRAVRRLQREGKLELFYYECDLNKIGTVRQVS